MCSLNVTNEMVVPKHKKHCLMKWKKVLLAHNAEEESKQTKKTAMEKGY